MPSEQRCTDLGSNCICSEPVNTATFTEVSAAYWSPDDTTTKQCTNAQSIPEGFIEFSEFSANYQVVTSGEMFDALPNLDPSITHIVRTNVSSGGAFMGHEFADADPDGRIAVRFYLYRSPAFTFETGACVNSSKIFELFTGGITSLVLQGNGFQDGRHLFYGWGNLWNLSNGFDCCDHGPGPNGGDMPINDTLARGKWFRYEVAIVNPLSSGSVTVIKVWEKNITDDLDEVLILDTSIPTTQDTGDQWTSTQATTLKPDARIERIASSQFRNGTCGGYYGFTHFLAAAWATDADQRIGAAEEIEGGGSGGGGGSLALFRA